MLNKRSNLNLKKSLSFRLLSYVILCSVVFTLLASIIQLYVTYSKGVDAIAETLESIGKSYVPSIAFSVFQMDRGQLEFELNGVLALKDIVYIEVKEVIDGVEILNVHAGDPTLPRDIIRQFPLSRYIESSPGVLTVVAKKGGIYQRILESGVIILVTNALKLMPLSICIFFILQYMVTRHLSALAHYSKRLSLEKLDQEFKLNRRKEVSDELDELASAINHARIGLKEDFDEIQKLKESLTQEKNRIFTTLSCISEGVIATDPLGKVKFINPVAEKLLAWKQDEVMGQPIEKIYKVVDEITGDPIENPVFSVLQTDQANEIKRHLLLTNRTGEEISLEDSTAPIRDHENLLFGVVLTFRDVSEKKRDKLSLIQQQQELYKR